MKYLLVMQICSVVTLSCTPPMEHTVHYNSYYDCASAGYLQALKATQNLGKDHVDKNQIIINFMCKGFEGV